MNKKMQNKLLMMKTVLTLLRQNFGILNSVPASLNSVSKLENSIAGIESLSRSTQTDSKGITAAKETRQKILIEKMYEIASALYAIAAEMKDQVLQAQADFKKSDLHNQRDNSLVLKCTSLLALANQHLPELGNNGITQGDVQELENMKVAYADYLPVTRVTVAERKAANEKIKQLFKEADSLLKDQTDRIMVRFKTVAPDLYAAYKNTRKMVHYGTRYEKPGNAEEVKSEP